MCVQEVCGLKWSSDWGAIASGGSDTKVLVWSAAMLSSKLQLEGGAGAWLLGGVCGQASRLLSAALWCMCVYVCVCVEGEVGHSGHEGVGVHARAPTGGAGEAIVNTTPAQYDGEAPAMSGGEGDQ